MNRINEELSKAIICFSPKNNLKGLLKHEHNTWFWDLECFIGKTKKASLLMTITGSDNYYLLSFNPYSIKPVETEGIHMVDDSTALKLFEKYGAEWIRTIINKGLCEKSYYDEVEGTEETEWRYGGNKNIIFKKPPYIRANGLEKYGWKILQK